MSASLRKRTCANWPRYVRFVPIVLQKSPSGLCEIEICNYRIGAPVLLNRCCAFQPDLESIFLAEMLKILLQHNLPKADSCTAAKSISIRSPCRHTNIGPIVHQFCALSRASIIFFASATIASLGLFSSVAGLSGSADDEPGGKIIALQPFPAGLTSRRYPL